MKEIKNIEKIYVEKFDIYVDPYLTYEQIQQIVKAIITQDDWAVRQQIIDMLILYHLTDISKEELEKVSHDDLLKSGLIDDVKALVKNFNRIQEALDYAQSLPRALKQIADKLPEFKKAVQEVIIKNGHSNNK